MASAHGALPPADGDAHRPDAAHRHAASSEPADRVPDPRVASASDRARTATVSDNGGWCWFQDERALVDPATSTLVLGSVASAAGRDGDRRGGDIDLHLVDLDRLGESGAATTVTLHAALESDDHDDPALWRRSDGRWLAVYSRHKSDDLTRWRLSAPQDPSTWGPEQVFDWTTVPGLAETARSGGGARGVTYQNLHAIDGVLLCFVRAINDDPCYLVSRDEGSTWAFGGRLLTREKVGYVNGYARYASSPGADGSGRIDVVITEHHPRDHPTSVWHGHVEGGRLHRSDGTPVGAFWCGLEDPTPRAEDLTCVLRSGTVLDSARLTHAWTTDLRRYADGTVVALMTARADDTVGTATSRYELDPIDHRFVHAVLAPGASRWEVRELAAAGPQLFPHEEDYTGLGALDPVDPGRLWISTVVDPRDGAVTAHHEVYGGSTRDGGRSWTWTPVTEGSGQDNVRPIAVPGDASRSVLAWYRGSLSTSQAWDAQVMVQVAPR